MHLSYANINVPVFSSKLNYKYMHNFSSRVFSSTVEMFIFARNLNEKWSDLVGNHSEMEMWLF